AAGRTCLAWPPTSTRWPEAGSTTTEPSTAPSCASWPGASTTTWSDGPCRSSNDSGADTPERSTGWSVYTTTSQPYSPTGNSPHRYAADPWEPDDGRLSRPVLREPGGETPPGYSLGIRSRVCADE